MNKIRIKPELLSLLLPLHSKPFSAPELCEAYMRIPESNNLTKPQARQFILRNLKRLERAGLIEADTGQAGEKGNFRTSGQFRSGDYIKGSPHFKTDNMESSHSPSSINLSAQLSSHKLELATTVAEVEEYENLSQRNPEMRAPIQRLYNEARDRYSTLLGKVKATEALITLVQSE